MASSRLPKTATGSAGNPAGRQRMKRKQKDRIVDAILILLFVGAVGGSGYFIFKMMTTWNVKGLGW